MKHFHNLGIPMALATGSANPDFLVKISKRKELFSLCLHAVCSDDSEVKNGKPAPDIYLIAAKRFPIPPDSSQNVCIGKSMRLKCTTFFPPLLVARCSCLRTPPMECRLLKMLE